MSVLTRIKNNQITDSTIFANTKIAPGSIVGSLFNSNLTMTSDVTITGNLTVQGSSTYLTVASTNTYVNDPLIVMNNAFVGTNTNDIGLLFNRGSDTNQAFIWDESEDEFRLIATSETGDTYGAVTTSSFANVRVGNLTVQGAAAFGSLSTTGDIGAANLTLSGDAAVNGGDLTSTAATFNLINSNATTVNFAGAATTLIVGSTTGTANIRNATINLIGNTTVGGTLSVTGPVTLEGVTSTGATGTGNLVFSTSSVLTTPNIGTPSFANLTNAIDLPISTGVSGLATGVADFLATPTSSNLISAVTDETGTGNLVFSTSPTLTTPNIGTPSFANLTNAINLPISSLIGLATGIAEFLVTPSSSNLISAVTDETGTGNLVFSTSPTLETSLATTSTNFDLLNTSATTVNFAGAATALTVGANSGTLTVRNALLDVDGNATVGGTLGVTGDTTVTGDLAVNGGDITTTASTFNLLDANTTTVNAFGAATAIDLGAATGTLTINNPTVVGSSATQDLYNTTATTLNFAGAASTLIVGATSGVANIRNATTNIIGNATVGGTLGVTGEVTLTDNLTVNGDLAVNGGDLTTTATTFNLADATATTVNAFGSATIIDLGATSGTLTINNPMVVGTQTTQDLYNTTATTLNFAGAATTLIVGATSGTANLRNATTNIIGNATVGGTLGVTGLVTLTDDLAVNGGDITTSATTATVFSTTATTVDAFKAATDLELGATSGTLTINNPTVVGTQAIQDLYNTTATTLNFAGAATTLNIGADTGTATINNDTVNIEGNINVNKTTPSTNSTTGALVVDGGVGIAGNLNIGENVVITGNLTVQGDVTTLNTATLDVEDLNITVAKGAVDSAAANGAGLTVDGASATFTYLNADDSWNVNKLFKGTAASFSSTLAVTNDTTLTGDLAVNGGDITTTAGTFNLLDSTATAVNAFGSATAIDLGATTGTLTINNPTVVGSQATQDLYNTTATTINFAGVASTLIVGATTGVANLRNATTNILGNATVGGTFDITGDTILTGDLAVNGGDLTTTATTFNLLDTTATTVNAFGGASTIDLGATSGTLTINNPTVVGSSVTQDLYNTTATTVNFAGAATTLIVGSTTGTANLRNATTNILGNATVGGTFGITGDLAVNGGDITTTATTATVFNTNATTVDAFGAATDLEFGAVTGTLTLNNPAVVGASATQDLYNTTATTLNFAGAATLLTLGAATGTTNIRNALVDIDGNATVGGTLGITGDTTATGDLAVNGGDITTTATTATVFNTNATTVDAFKAATDLEFGATTGTLTLNNPAVVGSQSTQNLYNTTATTLNFAGAVTTANVGAGTGTFTLNNPTLVGSQLTQNVYNTVATTVNAFGDATSLAVGATSGTFSLRNANLHLPNATTIHSSQATLSLVNENVTTLNLGGAATLLIAGATSGTFSLRNANLHLPNATTIHSSQATVALLNENVNTVNGFGAATALTLGAATGTTSIRNATIAFPNATNIHVDQTSITVANVNATTVNAFGAATELNFAAVGGNTTIRGNIVSVGILAAFAGISTTQPTNNPADGTTSFFVGGGSVLNGNVFISEEANISYANIYDSRISTSSSTGALTVRGGVGLGANLNVNGGAVININQTVQPFQVKGQVATTLIYADSTTDTVTIGGSNTTPISGATLRVNGTGAMVLPVGTTGQRPGTSGNVDVDGMIRINSSLNILEYYANDAWQSSQGSFTVIASEAFSGNGVATVFTMSGPATTSSTIVSINGIVQIPATSYSVTDAVLTFTEAPDVGDTIDVRRLTTTVSVEELGFGQNIFKANASYAYIGTGSVTTIERLLVDNDGLVTVTGDMEIYGNLTVKGNTAGQINIGDSNTDNVAITAEINSNLVPNANNTFDLGSPTQRWRDVYSHATIHDQTPNYVGASATPVLIDTFTTSTYSSAKYLVQIKDGSNVQAAELLLVQDTANAFITTYGVLSSNVELGGFTANISSGNVNLFYTSTTATNSNVKVHTTYIV